MIGPPSSLRCAALLHIGQGPPVIANDGHVGRSLQRRQGLGDHAQHRPALVLAVVAGALRGSAVAPEELLRTATDTR